MITKQHQTIKILITHRLSTLKKLFYDLLHINPPKDIFIETDEGYIKSNISRILSFFILKIWANEIIELKDKLRKCEKCDEWFYRNLITRNPLCINCYEKDHPNKEIKRRGL